MRFTVVVITHQRRQALLRKLRALPGPPCVIAVDNASQSNRRSRSYVS